MHQIIQAVGGKELSAEMPPHVSLIKIISSVALGLFGWMLYFSCVGSFLLIEVPQPGLVLLAWLPPPPLLLSA